MKTIFGVSSATPIIKKLKNGYTMYDWVKRQKSFPAFCMRTLSGENKITAEEIEFLKSKDCKIGLVVRDLTEAKVSGVNGTEDALKAIKNAKELGVPANSGIALFAEIKPDWSVNHNWMISFAQVISANGYVPHLSVIPIRVRTLTLTVSAVTLYRQQRMQITLVPCIWQLSLNLIVCLTNGHLIVHLH